MAILSLFTLAFHAYAWSVFNSAAYHSGSYSGDSTSDGYNGGDGGKDGDGGDDGDGGEDGGSGRPERDGREVVGDGGGGVVDALLNWMGSGQCSSYAMVCMDREW